jgi:hypothetical protein
VSQRNVEWVVGRLVTDEAFRRRFAAAPWEVLSELTAGGCALNPCELRGLAAFDVGVAERCAEAVDPRLLKADLSACRE